MKQSAHTQTFRVDHSEHYCRCYHYCLPEIDDGYYDEEVLVVQIKFYKVNDELLLYLMMVNILLMVKLRSKKQSDKEKVLSVIFHKYLRFLSNN